MVMQNLHFFQSQNFNERELSQKMQISDVFSDKRMHLNPYTLYLAKFNKIPNMISEDNVNCKKAVGWVIQNFKTHIHDCYYNIRFFRRTGKSEPDDIYFFLFEDLLIFFDTGCNSIRYLYRNTPIDDIAEITNGLKRFRITQSRKAEISVIVQSFEGLSTTSFKMAKRRFSIEENYNNDFTEIHKTIFSRLSKKNDKGLVLLHGKPGTGKTSYIKFLITFIKKKVIILPPSMASSISDPGLIEILIENPNSILIIEDAENIVVDRERNGNSPVSALLNISDGLLSECLNIQVICTFNTHISKVDSALLRKGRLIAQYEFKELELNKAKALSQKLGFKTRIDEAMTLTAIYNQEEKDYQKNKSEKSIGFNIFQPNC